MIRDEFMLHIFLRDKIPFILTWNSKASHIFIYCTDFFLKKSFECSKDKYFNGSEIKINILIYLLFEISGDSPAEFFFFMQTLI